MENHPSNSSALRGASGAQGREGLCALGYRLRLLGIWASGALAVFGDGEPPGIASLGQALEVPG